MVGGRERLRRRKRNREREPEQGRESTFISADSASARRELGTHTRIPTKIAGIQLHEYHLLPLRICISRKVLFGVEL